MTDTEYNERMMAMVRETMERLRYRREAIVMDGKRVVFRLVRKTGGSIVNIGPGPHQSGAESSGTSP